MAARRSSIQGNAEVGRFLDAFGRGLRAGSEAVKDFTESARKGGKSLTDQVSAGVGRSFGAGSLAQGILTGGPVGGALAGLQIATDFVNRTNQAKASAELAAPLFASEQRVRAEGRAAASASSLETVAGLKDQFAAVNDALGPLGRLGAPFFGIFGGKDGSEDRDRARAIREETARKFAPVDAATDRVGDFLGEIAAGGGRIDPGTRQNLLNYHLQRERRRFAEIEENRRTMDAMRGLDPGQAAVNGPR